MHCRNLIGFLAIKTVSSASSEYVPLKVVRSTKPPIDRKSTLKVQSLSNAEAGSVSKSSGTRGPEMGIASESASRNTMAGLIEKLQAEKAAQAEQAEKDEQAESERVQAALLEHLVAEAKIAQLEARHTSATDLLHAHVREVEAKNNSLKSEFARVQASHGALQRSHEQVDAERAHYYSLLKDSLEHKATVLESSMQTTADRNRIAASLAQAERDIEDLKSSLRDQSDTNDQLREENANLRTLIAVRHTEIDTLKTQNAAQEREIGTLKTRITTQQAEIVELKKRT